MVILGVRVDNLSQKEILDQISLFLSDNKFHQIATINPEFILEAQKNEEFRNILNNCDLNVADGAGIKLAFWRNGEKLKERITGIDLMREILKIANNMELGVFLAAHKDGLSSWEETAKAILKVYPNLKIDGIDIDKKDLGYRLQVTGYKIVFCNFGAPFQEIFLNRQKNAIIGVAMGVGGAFDFITGKIRRAPVFVRKLGLEWLFRLVQQPKRIKRIFNAVIVFPIKIIINRTYALS